MFIAHALLKYFVFTPAGTAQFFESLGLPGFLAYATIAAELGGGVLLIAGVYTRTVAFALVPVLLGATWAHFGNGWLFTSPKGGWEYPAFLTLAADRRRPARRRSLLGRRAGSRRAGRTLAARSVARRAAARVEPRRNPGRLRSTRAPGFAFGSTRATESTSHATTPRNRP